MAPEKSSKGGARVPNWRGAKMTRKCTSRTSFFLCQISSGKNPQFLPTDGGGGARFHFISSSFHFQFFIHNLCNRGAVATLPSPDATIEANVIFF